MNPLKLSVDGDATVSAGENATLEDGILVVEPGVTGDATTTLYVTPNSHAKVTVQVDGTMPALSSLKWAQSPDTAPSSFGDEQACQVYSHFEAQPGNRLNAQFALEFDSEPEPEPDPGPEPELEPTPEPEPELEPTPVPEPDEELLPEPSPDPQPETQPRPESGPDVRPVPESQVQQSGKAGAEGTNPSDRHLAKTGASVTGLAVAAALLAAGAGILLL